MHKKKKEYQEYHFKFPNEEKKLNSVHECFYFFPHVRKMLKLTMKTCIDNEFVKMKERQIENTNFHESIILLEDKLKKKS